MTQPSAWTPEQQLREQRFSLVAACVSFLAVAVIDALAPKNVQFVTFYVVPIVALIWSRDRRLLWVFTLAAVVANAAVWQWGRAAAPPEAAWAAGVHRLLAGAGVVVAAALVQLQMASVQLADRRRESLRKQYAELQALNEQISQREEEIVRQNEELQSQSEELERQSEELRISNEELAGWEKRLEQLLELSRSLTAELSREEMLDKICESLALLSEGRPALIFERVADELSVICHHGFGPDGPRPSSLPLQQTFSGLVMSVGQTAYVEDVQQRPELRLPDAPEGGAFRSVLAAPLLVRGRCIGTIEVLSTQPRIWEQAEISMIESLAAQASVSLQGAELVDEIRRERRRFEAAFRTVPFGMAITDDPEGRDVRINPAAAALLNVAQSDNISPHGPLGERLSRYMFQHDEPLGIEQHPLLRAARGEEIVQEEIELLLPQRQHVTLLTSAAPVYDSSGKIVGAVCAFADVTVQKALQR
ncbi:MAG TPA: GAF domain-containing protein, partial [Pirellulales bacterium]|nr:GAF domain-containing protein [Pirellulales bacterium]